VRLDKFLTKKGYFLSREKAKDAILQKTVKVNGNIASKVSIEIEENADIEIIDIFNRYVSRGGLKLEKAIFHFNLDFQGKKVLDVGASTGGFTDCALKHGAAYCFCVDVGSHQLVESIRTNPAVGFIENCDFRDFHSEQKFDFIVSDVSFISLTALMPYFGNFFENNGQMVLLIKPQFEAGPSFLNKTGIVTDDKAYKISIQRVVKEAINFNFYLQNLSVSTLFETKKNVEFLALFSRKKSNFEVDFKQLFLEVKNLKAGCRN
jgi:23S rRNA (cytidine1920-2'-O)/16S rRNA (cytidine1409-2'-O)-methyltransferase